MPGDDLGTNQTRREVLRRGAVVGGTLAWSAPAVQAIGMRPAFAQGSPPPPVVCDSVTGVMSTGQLAFSGATPVDLRHNMVTSDTEFFLYLERQDVQTYPAFDFDIPPAGGPYNQGNLPPAQVFPANSGPLTSWLIHADSTGTTDVTFSGTVTFPTPIVAMICRDGADNSSPDRHLKESDPFLGAPGTTYSASHLRRYIEIEGIDELTVISPTTISVTMRVQPNVDNLRILTQGCAM